MPGAVGLATIRLAGAELARRRSWVLLQVVSAAVLMLVAHAPSAWREAHPLLALLAASVICGVAEAALAPVYFGRQRDALAAAGFSPRTRVAASVASWRLAARALAALVVTAGVAGIGATLAAVPGLLLGLIANASGSARLGSVAETVGAAGCVTGFLGAAVLTCLSSRVAAIEGERAFDAVARSTEIVRRRWRGVIGALILRVSATVCAAEAMRLSPFFLAPLLLLAILARWGADVSLTSMLFEHRERRVLRRERRRSLGSAHRLAPAIVALVVGLSTIGRADVAVAQVSLLADQQAQLDRPDNGPITHPAGDIVTSSSNLVKAPATLDTIQAVVVARSETTAALDRLLQARINARQVALTQGDVAAAVHEVELAQSAVTLSSNKVRAALEANATTNRLLTQAEEQRVYGPDGPTTMDRVGSGLLTTGGVVTGMGQGTVVGAWDTLAGVGHALFHPIETGKAVVNALSKPAPTQAELSAQDTATLMRERSEQIAQVSAPFGTAREGGYIIGHDLLGPLAVGEVLGAAGSLAKTGDVVVADGLAAGGRVRVGEGAFSIAYREGNEIVKEIKPTVKGVGDVPVTLDAGGRARLASTTVELTNEVGDALGGGIVPKMVDGGNGIIRQPMAQGLTIQELTAVNPGAVGHAGDAMVDLTHRSAKILGLKSPEGGFLETPDGWHAIVDTNASNFRFDRQGNVVSWFDPIAVFPAPPAPIVR